MMESEDEEHPVGSKRITHGHKRQKSGKSRSVGLRDAVASGVDKFSQHLQEQRKQLPIARGTIIHKSE